MKPTSSPPTTKNGIETAELISIKAELDVYLKKLSKSADDEAIDKVIALFQKKIICNEKELWLTSPTQKTVTPYQNSYKALEQLYKLKSSDNRYNFKIVIPVADRPQHLKQCLNSLLTLCQSYEYGGYEDNQYTKISVLIADDSREANNIKLHQAYCAEFTAEGINIDYFGLEDQLSLVNNISSQHNGLEKIIASTENIKNIDDFSHKGASIMRNITYLKLHQDISDKNTLIYFIDSDQEFCITTSHSDADLDNKHYAINYFHCLNTLFTAQDISVLTGKVVGDPPVSPSVMAANFQLDIQNFISCIEKLNPDDNCQFHKKDSGDHDDAAYHDMASLFGFSSDKQVFNYQCTLHEAHNNADCFNDFSNKLSHFFYGEHPTRKTYFNYEDGFLKTSAARTVYTGNYVIKPEALDHFIPFATLKLRMAGPVLGRLLKSRLNDKFVSANLPMLHNRTVESTGKSEFRAGVTHHKQDIDLGKEFIRQFYGDIMLFTIEEISNAGYPASTMDKETLETVVQRIYETIRDNYIEKHNTILQLKSQIKQQLNNKQQWWRQLSGDSMALQSSLLNFDSFLNNIQSNFENSSNAFQQITAPDQVFIHLNKILLAIQEYPDNRHCWKNALKTK